MGYTSSNNKIKLVSINNTERIVSIKTLLMLIKIYSKGILTVSGADPKIKKYALKLKKYR